MDVQGALITIRALVMEKYRSLDEPHFTFKSKALAARPYDALILELLPWVWIYEVTDTNYDVAFEYLLRENHRDQSWRLELSMLGRYAALLRTGENNTSVVITAGRDDLLKLENDLLRLIAKHDITVLPQQILDEPVDIQLTNVEPGSGCIYHALFTDIPSIPWKLWQPRSVEED